MTEHSSKPSAASGCSNGKTAGLTIAVFVDGSHAPAAPQNAERIVFYARQSGEWAETRSSVIRPLRSTAKDVMASFLAEITALIGDAQAVAGASIAGKAYAALNRQGKHIFAIAEITAAQLSEIAEDIAAAKTRQALRADAFALTRPVETEIKGVYSLDLVTALEEFPELSSKMILKPFFRDTPFAELTIICTHVPQWLSQEASLQVRQKRRGEYLVVTIIRQPCGEAAL